MCLVGGGIVELFFSLLSDKNRISDLPQSWRVQLPLSVGTNK